MSKSRPDGQGADTARHVESDAASEIEVLSRVQEYPVQSISDLAQNPPELDYLQVELSNLQGAAREAIRFEESTEDGGLSWTFMSMKAVCRWTDVS